MNLKYFLLLEIYFECVFAYTPKNQNIPQSPYKDFISLYEGKNLEFWFPDERTRSNAFKSGQYKPDNTIPIDVDVYYPSKTEEPRIFITIPRFGSGIPYSLAYLTNVNKPNGSEFKPYPSYDWHKSHGKNCNGLTSIYRVQIDSCGQMWVLDSGEIEFKQFCPPSLAIFDLKTDELVHRYFLPPDIYKTKISRFITPHVDIADPAPHGKCKQAMAYLADATGFGFVVYDVVNEISWRIENKFTFPHPDFSTFTIAGESFELLEGVFGFTITPPNLGLERMLYFHSISNDLEIAIPLDIVNNATYWTKDISANLKDFIILGARGIQCAAPAITESGILLCGLMNPIALYGWNISTPYEKQYRKILAENPVTLQFVSGLKIIRNPHTGQSNVWLLSNRLQKAFSGNVSFHEINYRIQRCGVNELLTQQKCIN